MGGAWIKTLLTDDVRGGQAASSGQGSITGHRARPSPVIKLSSVSADATPVTQQIPQRPSVELFREHGLQKENAAQLLVHDRHSRELDR
jgi:hypothetical protein